MRLKIFLPYGELKKVLRKLNDETFRIIISSKENAAVSYKIEKKDYDTGVLRIALNFSISVSDTAVVSIGLLFSLKLQERDTL